MASFLASLGVGKKEETMGTILKQLNKTGLNSASLQAFKDSYERLKELLNFYGTDSDLQKVISIAPYKQTLHALERSELRKRSELLASLSTKLELYRSSFFSATTTLSRSPGLPEKIRESLSAKSFELDMFARQELKTIELAKLKYDRAVKEKPLTLNEKVLTMPAPPTHTPGKGGKRSKRAKKGSTRSVKTRKGTRKTQRQRQRQRQRHTRRRYHS